MGETSTNCLYSSSSGKDMHIKTLENNLKPIDWGLIKFGMFIAAMANLSGLSMTQTAHCGTQCHGFATTDLHYGYYATVKQNTY